MTQTAPPDLSSLLSGETGLRFTLSPREEPPLVEASDLGRQLAGTEMELSRRFDDLERVAVELLELLTGVEPGQSRLAQLAALLTEPATAAQPPDLSPVLDRLDAIAGELPSGADQRALGALRHGLEALLARLDDLLRAAPAPQADRLDRIEDDIAQIRADQVANTELLQDLSMQLTGLAARDQSRDQNTAPFDAPMQAQSGE
ncbi:hypothetical protein [Sagittula sp. SSi028]|uniref:hypothetical protein n=1 Tax=Sagittula sp. SSi028 TaxID=3400636 RepID=UPI003AF6CAB5